MKNSISETKTSCFSLNKNNPELNTSFSFPQWIYIERERLKISDNTLLTYRDLVQSFSCCCKLIYSFIFIHPHFMIIINLNFEKRKTLNILFYLDMHIIMIIINIIMLCMCVIDLFLFFFLCRKTIEEIKSRFKNKKIDQKGIIWLLCVCGNETTTTKTRKLIILLNIFIRMV